MLLKSSGGEAYIDFGGIFWYNIFVLISNNNCIHGSVSLEQRKTPPRFIQYDGTHRLRDVLSQGLSLPGMPFEYNTTSPTPLDPEQLMIHSIASYPGAAMQYMAQQLDVATEGLDIPEKYIHFSEAEITKQHEHRMHKNIEAMDRWRRYAEKNDITVSREEAEGIMQIRAGISQFTPIAKLLSRVPEIEAIEAFKATRPFCIRRHLGARVALLTALRAVGDSADKAEISPDASPYRFFVDPEHATIITKTKFGEIALNGVSLEIIGRESFQGVDMNDTSETLEYMKREIGPAEVALVPIDITSYIRVKSIN